MAHVVNNNRYQQLAAAMLRTGILRYGGGPSVIPLIRYEAVTRYRWLNDEEFGEILASPLRCRGLSLRRSPLTSAMMAVLAWQMASNSAQAIGSWQSLGIAAVAFWALWVRKFHPAFVILAAFAYGGGLVLSHSTAEP